MLVFIRCLQLVDYREYFEHMSKDLQDNSAQTQRIEFTRNWLSSQQSIAMFIRATVSNSADAEDILQEVACQVAAKYDEYDPARAFLPWAIGVSKIKIAEYYRNQKKHSVVHTTDLIESLAEACFRLHSYLHPYSAALEECLRTLDEKSAHLLTLRYQENLSPQNIAKGLNTSSGTIRVTLTRIRNRLKNCMQARVDRND